MVPHRQGLGSLARRTFDPEDIVLESRRGFGRGRLSLSPIQQLQPKENRAMNERIIDCSGSNFLCPENRGYVIFDPESQEENDRLDQLLGATKLWQQTLEKKRKTMGRHTQRVAICPFSELHPVGYTETAEAVCVVLAGNTGKEFQATGQWFAVRVTAGGEAELLKDLQEEIEVRKQKLVSMSHYSMR